MAFSAYSFSKLRAFRPRAFIKVAAAEDSRSEAGIYGNVTFGQDTFRSMAFAPRSLHGLRRTKRKVRMVGHQGRFDARGGEAGWTITPH